MKQRVTRDELRRQENWKKTDEGRLMQEEVSDQTAFQKHAFVPRVNTTGRNAISNGEVTGARKATLTDLK